MGSAHRAGWFRGSYKVWRQTAGILYSRKQKGAPLRGRLYRRVVFASLKGRWGKTVFPKVDAASPRGLMEPPGLTPLGTKGSVRDRLPTPGLFEGSAQGSYKASLPLGRYGAFGANIKCREAAIKLIARRATPQPLGPQGPSNLRTLRPIGPVHLKNLFPQPFYTTHGGAVPLRAQRARPSEPFPPTGI